MRREKELSKCHFQECLLFYVEHEAYQKSRLLLITCKTLCKYKEIGKSMMIGPHKIPAKGLRDQTQTVNHYKDLHVDTPD